MIKKIETFVVKEIGVSNYIVLFTLLFFNMILLSYYVALPFISQDNRSFWGILLISNSHIEKLDLRLIISDLNWIICLIIVKFVFLDYYQKLEDTIKEVSNLEISKIVNLLLHKYQYYDMLYDDVYDPEILENRHHCYTVALENYKQFMKEVHNLHLRRNSDDVSIQLEQLNIETQSDDSIILDENSS